MLDSRYIALLLPIFAIACFIFIILIIYIHFCIEKPIQLLNTRLEEVNIVHPLPPLALRSNDEIGELYKHFNKMEHRLQLAHKEQIDMIAAIAHDLKTPLTSINGFTELLATHKDLPETEKQEYYDLIQRKSGYMVELINDFSSFTKEKLELESMVAKPVKASKLFENIALEYEYELAGLDNELTCRHSFTENILLMVNEPKIRRVFGNLFSNAVRYGGKNKLKVYMTGYPLGQYAFFKSKIMELECRIRIYLLCSSNFSLWINRGKSKRAGWVWVLQAVNPLLNIIGAKFAPTLPNMAVWG